MGRKTISDEPSPFYPPRARWPSTYSSWGNWIRRRLALDRLQRLEEMKVSSSLAAFLVPGLAVYLRGARLWGGVVLLVCALLLLANVVWLGYPLANLALGMLISIHVTGFVYFCNPLMASEPLRARSEFTILVLIAMLAVVYWPARSLIQNHLVTPLRINGRVMVVHQLISVRGIKPGDWLAYTLPDDPENGLNAGGALWIHSGAGFGPVLATAGDHVVFSGKSFSVNGVERSRLPNMPEAGEWIVPEKHWFIWPNIVISRHGDVDHDTINRVLLRMADVSPGQVLGQPFKRWFWRNQTYLPPHSQP